MNQAGILLIAVAGLWIAYLVPHRLRYRQQLLESRTDDRFSGGLRVIRVARKGAFARRRVTVRAGQVRLHPPALGGGGAMDRPHAHADRVVADAVRRSATEQAQRAAYVSRRVAGARRRAVLATALLVLAAAGWAGVFTGALSGVLAAGVAFVASVAPTALLGGVLVLGRHAVVMGRRTDAAWAAGRDERAARRALFKTAVGRAVRPSDADTEVIARVPVEDERAVADDAARSVGADSWTPVPVPRPTYTLKPAVRREEPAPLVIDAPETVAEPVGSPVAEPVTRPTGEPATRPAGEPVTRPAGEPAAHRIDLDAVLARRRAAG